jgi:hypothetical protein
MLSDCAASDASQASSTGADPSGSRSNTGLSVGCSCGRASAGPRAAANRLPASTWVRPSGTAVQHYLTVPAQQRVTVSVADEAGIAGQGEVSVAIQSLDPANALIAEHAQYAGSGWPGGRATEAVPAAPVWYLAEGSTTLFDEFLTVFNPPIDRYLSPSTSTGCPR